MQATWTGRLAVLALAAALVAAAPARAQLQWKSADEKLAFKVGILGQLQAESIDVADTHDSARNLFLRRARIVMGLTLGEKLSVFLDTDSPNLGKSNAAGVKDAGDVLLQDFVVTYKASQAFQLDAGLILPAIFYNHAQSAATFLAVDYGPYTFVEGGALGARAGRDYGLQARGYLADDHLEYRAGVFQGNRGTNAANAFRYYGRLMYQFGTPQTGLFYRGTSLGKTRTLAVGASYDAQEKYRAWSLDGFLDLPVGANGLSGQLDWTQWDGKTFLTTVPQQDTLLAELGFYFARAKVMPFLQYAEQNFDDAARVDEKKTTIGVGYFAAGHNHNLKLSYSRIDPAAGDHRDQWLVQWQVFQF